MKRSPHKVITIRPSPNHVRLLEAEKKENGGSINWLIENAIMIAYGGRDNKIRRAK